jgi:signal transduction histidine kinase
VADAVISEARARADDVRATARAESDRRAPSSLAPRSSGTVAAERSVEDRTLLAERGEADDALRAERAGRADGLATERAETDKDLSRERIRADESVATRDEFLGIVSHDLRNMVSGVLGFAVLIETEAMRDDQAARVVGYAQAIQRSSGRMNRLVGDLVDLASIEAGALAVVTEDVDPSLVLTEAIDSVRVQAAKAGVSLLADIPPLRRSSFDPARILQVLGNLLTNAIKFTPRGGAVSASVESIGPDLRFSVRDTGIGIANDKLETIFERFVQVAKGDRRGSGLGLYISKCIVQGHGGRIWAESVPGEGSTFSFTLPEPQPPVEP